MILMTFKSMRWITTRTSPFAILDVKKSFGYRFGKHQSEPLIRPKGHFNATISVAHDGQKLAVSQPAGNVYPLGNFLLFSGE